MLDLLSSSTFVSSSLWGLGLDALYIMHYGIQSGGGANVGINGKMEESRRVPPMMVRRSHAECRMRFFDFALRGLLWIYTILMDGSHWGGTGPLVPRGVAVTFCRRCSVGLALA